MLYIALFVPVMSVAFAVECSENLQMLCFSSLNVFSLAFINAALKTASELLPLFVADGTIGIGILFLLLYIDAEAVFNKDKTINPTINPNISFFIFVPPLLLLLIGGNKH